MDAIVAPFSPAFHCVAMPFGEYAGAVFPYNHVALRAGVTMYEFLHATVADYMTRQPVTVSPETTLAEVQGLFEGHGFNGMPVLDGEGTMVGFVTKMDVLRAFTLRPDSIVPHYSEIMARSVEPVMTRAPVTVPPSYPLPRVLQYLVELGFKSMPVMDADRLAGIIAREDVLEALRRTSTAGNSAADQGPVG